MTTENEEVTGKAKSAAALAKVNAERAAKKAAKEAGEGAGTPPAGSEGAGDGVGASGGDGAPAVVKSFADLDLLRDKLF